MKVLIDGLCLQQSGLGIRRYTNCLIDSYIQKYGRDNVKVIISKVTGDEFYDYILYTGSKKYLIKFFSFYRFLKTIDFDLLHSPANLNYLRKVKGKFYVITMHDIMYRTVPYFYTTNWFLNFIKVRMSDVYTYFSLKNSDLIITISKTSQRDLSRYFHKESVIVTIGTYELPDLSTLSNDYLINNKLAPKSYFLYVGSKKHHKNVDFLIRSYLRSSTAKRLVICGFSEDKTKVNSDRIFFTGHISDADLSVLYANADAFVFPSLYEGFGAPVLEALQYGVKVYSSTGGSLKEFPDSVIKFFDPTNEEELIDLLNHSDEFTLDQASLSTFLRDHNWEIIKKQVQDIVEKAYKSTGRTDA